MGSLFTRNDLGKALKLASGLPVKFCRRVLMLWTLAFLKSSLAMLSMDIKLMLEYNSSILQLLADKK